MTTTNVTYENTSNIPPAMMSSSVTMMSVSISTHENVAYEDMAEYL